MRFCIGICLVLFSMNATSAPSPFGLKVKGDCDQLADFDAKQVGINKYSNGKMYEVSAAEIDFRDLRHILAICDQNEKLVAVLAKFRKQFGGATFDRLVGMLDKKYTKVEVNSAHVGNQDAKFKANDVLIIVEEPHMSKTTTLLYATENFHSDFIHKKKNQENDTKGQEQDQL